MPRTINIKTTEITLWRNMIWTSVIFALAQKINFVQTTENSLKRWVHCIISSSYKNTLVLERRYIREDYTSKSTTTRSLLFTWNTSINSPPQVEAFFYKYHQRILKALLKFYILLYFNRTACCIKPRTRQTYLKPMYLLNYNKLLTDEMKNPTSFLTNE